MQKDLYAASCNPPRRAKRSVSVASDMSSTTLPNYPRAMLPIRPYAPRPAIDVDATALPPPPVPARRGRKPGPLSRTAREAQRRLNHSIIEKARRTKINDALATLKELVPTNYGRAEPPAHEEDDDDDDDDEGEYQDGPKKAKTKPKGKKDEKEKEFKLEILVRTVSFLQDLLKRVSDLEATASPTCENCASNGDPVKRKRKRQEAEDDTDDEADHRLAARPPKQPRVIGELPLRRLKPSESPVLPSVNVSKSVSQSIPDHRADSRLPSISSWLPNSSIDPSFLPPPKSTHPSPSLSSYLPSPPSSTPFDPVRSSQIPPVLHLNPRASTSSSTSPISPTTMHRTSEDENAASLLLQISTSPSFRPVSSSGPGYGLSEPSTFVLESDIRNTRDNYSSRQPQTPGSLLGLNAGRKEY